MRVCICIVFGTDHSWLEFELWDVSSEWLLLNDRWVRALMSLSHWLHWWITTERATRRACVEVLVSLWAHFTKDIINHFWCWHQRNTKHIFIFLLSCSLSFLPVISVSIHNALSFYITVKEGESLVWLSCICREAGKWESQDWMSLAVIETLREHNTTPDTHLSLQHSSILLYCLYLRSHQS